MQATRDESASQSPARALARAAAAVRWETTPPDVRRQALDLIADTLAVISAGAVDPSIRPAMEALRGPPGACVVIGHGARAGAAAAALVNGAATTVLQLQDGHRIARGHPMSHVLPAALAAAEEEVAGASDFLSAVVAGYEVAARVGRALGGLQELLHDAGTFGAIGAAAATARLVAGADADAIERAIEASAAVALFPYRDTPVHGASAHHLYIGLGAATGVTAGRAACLGLAGLSGTLERFFGPRAGARFDPAGLLWGLAADGRIADYELLNAYFKLYPTCAHLNGVNDALLSLIAEQRPDPATIARVEIDIYAAALPYNNPHPANALAARFSIPYVVAIALTDGGLSFDAIATERLSNPDLRALAGRVVVRHDASLDDFYPAGRPTRVALIARDGSRRIAHCMHPRGGVAHPLSPGERRAKALALLAPAYGAEGAQAVARAVDALPEAASVADLSEALMRSGDGT